MFTDRQIKNQYLNGLYHEIMHEKDYTLYDHRDHMPDLVKQRFPHMLENEQLDYSRLKFAVAAVLNPRTIYEVGFGWGVSARAFEAGTGFATRLYAIDNGEMGMDVVTAAAGNLGTSQLLLGTVNIVPSDALASFIHPHGQIDLIHIDGGHGRDQKARDLIKAIEARPEWILVDDFHNVQVAAGTFDGLYKASDAWVEMIYLPDSHTGNLLIHAGRKDPQYR